MAQRKKHSSIAACSLSMYLLESGLILFKSPTRLVAGQCFIHLKPFDPSLSSLVKPGLKFTEKTQAVQ